LSSQATGSARPVLWKQGSDPGQRRAAILPRTSGGLRLRISQSKKFLLFHLPRTGVSSIIAALDDGLFVRAAPTTLNKFCSKTLPFLPRAIENTCLRTHETARHVRRLLPREVFDAYRKIAFVRNPYSWLVSMYELVLQSPNHRHYRRLSRMRAFSEYVDWEIRRNKRTQHAYLCDRHGELLVDEIGHFERLADDAARIFRSIDVDIEKLPCIGQFTRRDYREFYDAETRARVARHWARDLALFNYDFDGLVAY